MQTCFNALTSEENSQGWVNLQKKIAAIFNAYIMAIVAKKCGDEEGPHPLFRRLCKLSVSSHFCFYIM